MIIVHNITEGNEIRFIPREGYATTAVLTDQVTGESIEETVDFTRDGYYSLCTINASLVDQRRYNLKIYSYSVMSSYVTRIESENGELDSKECALDFIKENSDTEVLYNGIVFCSTQDNADYSISNGEFNYDSVQDDSASQFIIID